MYVCVCVSLETCMPQMGKYYNKLFLIHLLMSGSNTRVTIRPQKKLVFAFFPPDHDYHNFDIYRLPLCQEDVAPETTFERAICYSVHCFA